MATTYGVPMHVDCPDCKQHSPVRIVADPPLLVECDVCGSILEVQLMPVGAVRDAKSRPA